MNKENSRRPLAIGGTSLLVVLVAVALIMLFAKKTDPGQKIQLGSIDVAGVESFRPLESRVQILPHEKEGYITLGFDGVDPNEPRKPFDTEKVWHAAATIDRAIAKGDIINLRYIVESKQRLPLTLTIGTSPEPGDRELHRVISTNGNGLGSVIFKSKRDYPSESLNVYIGLGLGRAPSYHVGFKLLDISIAAPDDAAKTGLMVGNSLLPPDTSIEPARRSLMKSLETQARQIRQVPVTVHLDGRKSRDSNIFVGAETLVPENFRLMVLIRNLARFSELKDSDRWRASEILKGWIVNDGISPGIEIGSGEMSPFEENLASSILKTAKALGLSPFVRITEKSVSAPPGLIAYCDYLVADPEIVPSSKIREILASRRITLMIPARLPLADPQNEKGTYAEIGKRLNDLADSHAKTFGCAVTLMISPEYQQSVPQTPEWRDIFSIMSLDYPFIISLIDAEMEDDDSMTNKTYYAVAGAYQQAKGRGVMADCTVGSVTGSYFYGWCDQSVAGAGLVSLVRSIGKVSQSRSTTESTIELRINPGRTRFSALEPELSGGATIAEIVGGETVRIPLKPLLKTP